VLVDTGYLEVRNVMNNTELSYKKTKGHKLTKKEEDYNKKYSVK
jgi:hypothetical protein